jgi:hypothetical protein
MQEENIKKMSEIALPQLTDVPTINILVCFLLNRLKREVTKKQLYDILVDSEIVSYFFYQESIAYLLKTGSLEVKDSKVEDETLEDDDRIIYILTEQGISCAVELENYISKIYRDSAVLTALSYFSMEKFKNQVKIDYIKNPDGYYVHIRCLDKKSDLMELKFNVPTLEQAKFLGKKVMKNPASFYSNIWQAFDINNKNKSK